jgi:hypothetical protein
VSIFVDVNSALLVDAVLDLGGRSETITVPASAVQTEMLATQLGDVINAANVAPMPLNGRSYTDLLALQPGLVPATTITSLTVQGLGQSVFSPSGDLNPWTLSINGQRESMNGFKINGANAEETGSLAAAIIPNLDSISEFRILSANFDAEYGRFTEARLTLLRNPEPTAFTGTSSNFCGTPTLTRAIISPPLTVHSSKTSSEERLAAPSKGTSLLLFGLSRHLAD